MEIYEDFFITQHIRNQENEIIINLGEQKSNLFTWFLKKFSGIQSTKFKEMSILLFNRLSNLPMLQKETEKIFLISLARISYKIHGNLPNDSIALNTFVDIIREEENAFISVFDLNQTEIFLMNYLNWDIKVDTLSFYIERILGRIWDSLSLIVERNNEFEEILNSLIEATLINLLVNQENLYFLSLCIVITLLEIVTDNKYMCQIENYRELLGSSIDFQLIKDTSNILMKLTGFFKNSLYNTGKKKLESDLSTKESYYYISYGSESQFDRLETKRSQSIDINLLSSRSERIGIKPIRKYLSSKNMI